MRGVVRCVNDEATEFVGPEYTFWTLLTGLLTAEAKESSRVVLYGNNNGLSVIATYF